MSKIPTDITLIRTNILPPVEEYDKINVLHMNKQTMVDLINHLVGELSNTGTAMMVMKSKENQFFIVKLSDV